MALKQFLKNSFFTIFNRNISIDPAALFKKISVIVYPIIFVTVFVIYSITFNSVNDQKSQN